MDQRNHQNGSSQIKSILTLKISHYMVYPRAKEDNGDVKQWIHTFKREKE